jgi:hypothetical protein
LALLEFLAVLFAALWPSVFVPALLVAVKEDLRVVRETARFL